MWLKKYGGILLVIALMLTSLVSVKIVKADEVLPDLNRKGTITVLMSGPEGIVRGGALTIYHVADLTKENGKIFYELTPEFKDSKIDLSEINEPGIAQDFDLYVLEKTLKGTEKPVTEDGTVCFDDLELGIYLIRQTKTPHEYYPTETFLVSVPMKAENGWFYKVDATPKMELNPGIAEKPDAQDKKIDVTVIKEWEDDEADRPKSVTVGLYNGERLFQKIELNEECDWTFTWEKLTDSIKWVVKEIDVPKGYTVTYDVYGNVTTITNTSSLIQTGQLNWPVPVMAGLGMIFILAGTALLYGKRKKQ